MRLHLPAGTLLLALGVGAPAAASTDPVVTSVIAGTTAGTAAASATSPRSRTMPAVAPGWMTKDWVDPRTGVTSRLVHGCDHIVEVSFSTAASRNYVVLSVYNGGYGRSTLQTEDVRVRFPSGRERRLVPVAGAEHVKLDPGWWTSGSLMFPEKEDFAGQDSMTLEVPLGGGPACTIEIDVVRDPAVPRDPRTSTRYQRMELYLAGGPHLGSNGGPSRAAGTRGGMFEIGGAWYPAINHGLTFDLMLEAFGPSGGQFEQKLGPFAGHPRMLGAGFFTGYVLRGYATPWLSGSIGAALGPYPLQVADDDGAVLEEIYLVTYSRLRLDAILGHVEPLSAFTLGVSVAHHYLPSGSFAGVDVSGTHYSAALRLGLGGM